MKEENPCKECINKYDVKKCIKCGHRSKKYGKEE